MKFQNHENPGALVLSLNRRTQLPQPVLSRRATQVDFWGEEVDFWGGDSGICPYSNVL